ncbi:VOC family protein [Daejeonella lutea]|uniref:Glyoxalase/Bleomycin resistance protein/Dioxygenase superfamily protein n=1 Tax=Daejeonella lutea TaxID=572036 RepID=A0A1T5BCC1_9SPHI|nr:VOC family protein [Daejeonella lutea]SKB44961.1 Glyoxalase/Bleomycin resistance protein/Dioxygenase superfamily protein [Daejeonella lutea]
MEESYIPVIVNKLDRALRFFTGKLNFIVSQEVELLPGLKTQVVSPQNRTLSLVLVESPSSDHIYSRNKIIIKTDDCIRDYCTFKKAGVRFKSEPQYNSTGLMANFSDPFGNLYALLEVRNYKVSDNYIENENYQISAGS